ncbi:MAG: glutamate ligase domain-containing protein, partial [Planctomycetota bacterium]
ALADFSGLEHRLQFVGEHNGVKYYNDSKCTTPDAAVLALDAFEPGTAHIILGGYDKNADLTPIAMHAARNAAAIYTLGDTGPSIARLAAAAPGDAPVHPCQTLENATRAAQARHARTGRVAQPRLRQLGPVREF